jgi:hypothetical protein
MQLYTTGVWGTSSQPMAALCKTARSSPYSIIAEVGLASTGDQWGGLAWRNSSNGKTETMNIWNGTTTNVVSMFTVFSLKALRDMRSRMRQPTMTLCIMALSCQTQCGSN